MRKTASIASIVLGVLMVIGGIATWIVVSSTLSDQNIVTADDACLPGRSVADPFTAYRALRHVNPSPYMYFLRLGKLAIVGASPEMLVKKTGRRLSTPTRSKRATSTPTPVTTSCSPGPASRY